MNTDNMLHFKTQVTKQTTQANSKASSAPKVENTGIRKGLPSLEDNSKVRDREASALEEGLLLHTEEVEEHGSTDPDAHRHGLSAVDGRRSGNIKEDEEEDEYYDDSSNDEAGNALHEADSRPQT
jgi:hypothetical protein